MTDMALPGFCESIPMEDYNRDRSEFLSSTDLVNYADSPALYKHFRDYPRDPTPNMDFGTAAHKMILEGEPDFDLDYVIDPGAEEFKTKDGKVSEAYRNTSSYKKWASEQARSIIGEAEYHAIKEMDENVKCHPEAGPLMAEFFPEVTVRSMYCGRLCQIRVDALIVKGDQHTIVDLKTTSNLAKFHWTARDLHYLEKAAFYQGVYQAASQSGTGSGLFLPPTYRLVVVETNAPYRVAVWKWLDNVMDDARKFNEDTIRELLDSEARDYWPTGYEEIQEFEVF